LAGTVASAKTLWRKNQAPKMGFPATSRRADILNPVILPNPACISKRRDATVCRKPCATENNNLPEWIQNEFFNAEEHQANHLR
jgi:hypothetical protein